MSQGGHQTPGIDLQQRRGFLVRVDFNILVGDTLGLEGDPHALDEGAETAAVELQVLVGGVVGDGFGCLPSGFCVVVLLGHGFGVLLLVKRLISSCLG